MATAVWGFIVIAASAWGGFLVYGSTNPSPCPDSTIDDIGSQDCWLLAIDDSGNRITDKIFGGSSIDRPFSIVPYLKGYVAVVYSGSKTFTEGTTYGNFDTSAANPAVVHL